MEDVAVVVLGDLGRSPRMQYHAASLAALLPPRTGPRPRPRPRVHVVALAGGERCVAAVEQAEAEGRLDRISVPVLFARWPRRLFLLYAPLKVAAQLLHLLALLLWVVPLARGRSAVLLQNPPSIPTLLCCWLACRLRGARLIVDWHNFGFSVLDLSLGGRGGVESGGGGSGGSGGSGLLACARGPLVAFSRSYERFFAGCADASLCVTHAMKAWLVAEWGLSPATVTVLHDRAPPAFREPSLEEQHALFMRLAPQLPSLLPEDDEAGAEREGGGDAEGRAGRADAPAATAAPGTSPSRRRRRASDAAAPSALPAPSSAAAHAPERTLFTERLADGRVRRRPGRPALLVSSTSWTADEDFGVLLEALALLDAAPGPLPRFVVVVTGKGPQRAEYEARMARLRLRRVRVATAWLEAADYPLLLGSGDLGVCLHTSSSGLDLPMKVVDMFGAGLPVCAVGFACLGELVRDGHNGLVFATAAELAAQLERLFGGSGGAGGGAELARLRTGVREFQALRWHDNWLRNAAPLFK